MKIFCFTLLSSITAITVTYCVLIENVQSMKVIPQKVNVTYFNEKYIKWCSMTIKRHGRKSDYYMNVEGVKYDTWGDNFTLSLIFNEFLHNEYRRSFVEMHFKLCDLINKDPYVGGMLKKYVAKCPVEEREVHFMNMTVPTAHFPYEFPFEKARVDGQISITKTKEMVVTGHIFVTFKK